MKKNTLIFINHSDCDKNNWIQLSFDTDGGINHGVGERIEKYLTNKVTLNVFVDYLINGLKEHKANLSLDNFIMINNQLDLNNLINLGSNVDNINQDKVWYTKNTAINYLYNSHKLAKIKSLLPASEAHNAWFNYDLFSLVSKDHTNDHLSDASYLYFIKVNAKTNQIDIRVLFKNNALTKANWEKLVNTNKINTLYKVALSFKKAKLIESIFTKAENYQVWVNTHFENIIK